ncbi:MAG: hypothetical protein U0939_25710 [Pirellulales bacterium]
MRSTVAVTPRNRRRIEFRLAIRCGLIASLDAWLQPKADDSPAARRRLATIAN